MSVLAGNEAAVVGEPASEPHQASVIGEPPNGMDPVLGEPVPPFVNGLRSDRLPGSAKSVINGICDENATAAEFRDSSASSAASNVEEPARPVEASGEESLHRSAPETQRRSSGAAWEDLPANVEIMHITEPPPPPPLPEIPTDNPFSVLDEVPREMDFKPSDDFEVPAALGIRYENGVPSLSKSNVEEPVASEEDIPADVEVMHISDHPPLPPPPETEIPVDNPFSVLDQVPQEAFVKLADDSEEPAAPNISYDDGDQVVSISRATSNVEKPATPEEEIPADVEVTHISEYPPPPPENETPIDNPFSVLEEVPQEIDVNASDDFEDDNQHMTSSVKDHLTSEEEIPADVVIKHITDYQPPPPESKVPTDNPFSVLEQVSQEIDGKLSDDFGGPAASNISRQDDNHLISGESAPDLVSPTHVAEAGEGHDLSSNAASELRAKSKSELVQPETYTTSEDVDGGVLGLEESAEVVPDGDVTERENDASNEGSTRSWSTPSHANNRQTHLIEDSSQGKSDAKKNGSFLNENVSTKNGDDYEALRDPSLKHFDNDVSVTSAPLKSSGQRSVPIEENIFAESSVDKVSLGEDGSKESKSCIPLSAEKPVVKDEKSSPFTLPVILTVVVAVLGVVAISISRSRR